MKYVIITCIILCFLSALSMVISIINMEKERKEKDALELEIAQCEYDLSKCIERLDNYDFTKMTDDEYNKITDEINNLFNSNCD